MKNKRSKNLIILASVLALLIIAYLVTGVISSDSGDTSTEETHQKYSVADVPEDGISKICMTVKYLAGGDHSHGENGDVVTEDAKWETRTLTLLLDGETWTFEEYPNVPVNPEVAQMIVDDLNGATSTQLISVSDESSLSNYGFDEPTVTLKIRYTDGSERELLIGAENSFNYMYYFLDTADKTKVYMVDDTLPSLLSGDVLDFVLYDEIPKLADGDVTTLKWNKGDMTLLYTYYPKGNEKDYTNDYLWYLSVNGGAEYAVDEDVAALINEALTTMSYLDCLACDNERDAEYGLDKAGRLEVNYKSDGAAKTLVLYLGTITEDGYYHVRPEGSILTYHMSSTASDNLDTIVSGLERDIRPDEVFYADYERVDSVSFSAGANTLSVALSHTDGKITYTDQSGAELNYDAYAKICNALEELRATSYTSVYEGDESFGNELIFKADLTFNAGETAAATLEIRRYSEKYCVVSFMGRGDQLVTLEKANSLATLLGDYFKA